MKIYSLYTPNHQIFFDEWFMPTFKDKIELDIKLFDIKGEGIIGNKQFYHAMHHKVDTIIRGINENFGDIIIYSDIDIQFFQPIETIVANLIKDKDILIQRDSPFGVFCAGFIVLRCDANSLRLFNDVKDLMFQRKTHDDQQILNELLYYKCIEESYFTRFSVAINRRLCYLISKLFEVPNDSYRLFASQQNSYNLRVAHLPDEFCSGGTFSATVWEPGLPLHVPENIILHHGNWAKGVKHKVAQMEYVKQVVAARCT